MFSLVNQTLPTICK